MIIRFYISYHINIEIGKFEISILVLGTTSKSNKKNCKKPI
jgi:hypothetical protein